MTPQEMSALHGRAFTDARGWSPAEFADLLSSPYVKAHVAPGGFALTRTLAGESELLTLAVDPDHQRRGIARQLLQTWLQGLHGNAQVAFLEVAADNQAACALYAQAGFVQIACRTGYYTHKDRPAVDALILQRRLTLGQSPESASVTPESG